MVWERGFQGEGVQGDCAWLILGRSGAGEGAGPGWRKMARG